ncbi:hypothetical protein BGZ58_000324 [Dissophora ornata]|nr:hypothetical protein BGZ58_000324 [Dissophora ornata]
MFSHSSPQNNTSSTPASAANTPAASPRVVRVPSEASALLQSLLVENNIMPATINTISGDFCLFEADESSFDYPLFAESLKLQQQQHQLLQYQQRHHLQQQQQQAPNPTLTNPLCTPQTPSLDLVEQNNRANNSFGFDGFSAYLDDSNGGHCAPSVALIHLNENPESNGDCASLMAQQHSIPSLVDTPFSSYLDTPYETPYLGDFGLDNERAHAEANQALFGTSSSSSSGHGSGDCGNSHPGAFSLFPELNFDVAAALEGAYQNGNTIEPATLLMASSAKEHEVDYLQEIMASDSSPAISSSQTSLFHATASRNNSFDATYDDLEQDDEEDYENENDSSSSEDSCDDEDDDEFIPSRPLAAATGMSGFKRKALASFTSGGSSSSNDNVASASPFKRTRPELASPYGGKKRSPKTKKAVAAKRFSCIHPGCDRQFARLFNLHTHERTHDPLQVRPFVCSVAVCSKRFSRKHDLQRHEASVHKGERNYRCPTCSKPFSRQDGLRRHLTVRGSVCGLSAENGAADETEIGWTAT